MKVRAIYVICVMDLTWAWSVRFPLEDIVSTPHWLTVIFIVADVVNSLLRRSEIYWVL